MDEEVTLSAAMLAPKHAVTIKEREPEEEWADEQSTIPFE